MKKRKGTRLLSLMLIAILLFNISPFGVFADTAEQGAFVFVVEAEGRLVVAPEYVTYTEGQTVLDALMTSGHVFVGIENGMVTEIDGVGGTYTRSDETGSYDWSKQASEIKYFRFSEELEGDKSRPSEGLQELMTAMADYKEKAEDIQAAAKTEYDTAYEQFVGLDSASAQLLAENLNKAVSDYESNQTGTQYSVTFTDGSKIHSDIAITVKNSYGKVWEEMQDGILELPSGEYTFTVEDKGLSVQGNISVSGDMTLKAAFPQNLWLKLDTFRLSGSYGAEDNEDSKFSDDEFKIGEWTERGVTVPVTDTFTGKVYSYAEYDTTQLSAVPKLTAIYKDAKTEKEAQVEIPFESLTSGAGNVLKKGAAGNTVVYRISTTMEDGYIYSQDYTVTFERIPSLLSLSVTDQDGVDQVATEVFDGDLTEYVYKVLDTTTSVTVNAEALDDSYDVMINGQNAADGVTVPVSGEETEITVTVKAGEYSNTYTLNICPGEGKKLSFITERADVTVEVVNSNGEVIPYTQIREGNTNKYQYVLVPGETYSYIATAGTYYHVADEFTMENAADSTIRVDVSTEDWLTDLAFGLGGFAAKYKGTLKLDTEFVSEDHRYAVDLVDTEHLAYIWAVGEEGTDIKVVYNQLFSSALYHGKERQEELISGSKTGTQLKRFLMAENPFENVVTIRLIKEVDGVTCYQDYEIEFLRTLTLKDLSAKCDGITATLIQSDGTTGYDFAVKEYSVTVSMAATMLELFTSCYTDNLCYGEEQVGYRIKVDGVDVTESDVTEIPLNGTIETQDVTITVENDKASNGTTDYILHILKSPPVEAAFELTPGNALLVMYETMSGQRIWPDEEGRFQLCEGYSYHYAFTQYGYISKSGTLDVTRDDDNKLVVADGDENYVVTESEEGGGSVTISWNLEESDVNDNINTGLISEWPNFRGNDENNGVTDVPIPTAAEKGTLYWANKIGDGFDSDAAGSPIIVDGELITYAGDTIYRIDTVSGEIIKTGKMDHKSSFSITPPTYYQGMVFVALSNGTIQAFDAVSLESLWIYADSLGGQPNCPITVKNGYLYTGFWNSETGDANFICLSVTDEDPSETKEEKCASWHYTKPGGYYWAGAYVSDEFVMIGTDDGTNRGNSPASSMLLLEPKTGELLDCWDNLNGDIRSTVVYDKQTDAYYFTSKGGSLYSVKVEKEEDGWHFTAKWKMDLANGTSGTPMSTCSPVVYNGRAYVGVSGSAQFGAYAGHNITVIDLNEKTIAYNVPTQGYPQTSGLLTTAFEEESGYVYVYFFDNYTPGKLRVLRDRAGQTKADYVTTEGNNTTAYAIFTPTGDQAQYAICSPIVDEYGTLYFKNDSAYLMAFGSQISKIEVTKLPDKMTYAEGERFNPDGMVVTATYENGKTRDITDYVTYSSDIITADDVILTISFEHVMYHNEENGTSMKSGVVTTTPYTTLELKIGEDTEEGTDILYGDVNGDDKVNIKDANLIVNFFYENVTFSEEQKKAADVNGDCKINIKDANLIISYFYENILEFPVQK